jgi:DNA repair protein RadA/Sms
MTKPKRVRSPVYVCSQCLTGHARWPGATCPTCGAFSTSTLTLADARARGLPLPVSLLGDETRASRRRWPTGLDAFDTILSHERGIVPGASVLLASTPGGGKTTLLVAACGQVALRHRALYVSAEQDVAALRALAEKLGVADRDRLLPVARTNVEDVARLIADTAPAMAVVDSANELAKQSGRQVGEVVGILHGLAHETGAAIFITSHVNAAGLVRGGPALEHATDQVQMLTGDPRTSPRRELSASKNRYGDTTITTAIEMTAHGFRDVDEAPQVARRALGVGAALALVRIEGKVTACEVQTLVGPGLSNPRKIATSGCSADRVRVLVTTAERDGVIVAGDLVVRSYGEAAQDPGVLDAAIVAAIVSASQGRALPAGVAFTGEVALDGSVRPGDVTREDCAALGLRLIGIPGRNLVESLAAAALRPSW